MSKLNTNAIRHLGSSVDNMTFDASGRVLMPNMPAFFVHGGSGEASWPGVTITKVTQLNTVDYNVGSHFNPSTAVFTAPVTGKYHFDVGAYVYPVVQSEIFLYKNGSIFQRFFQIANGSESNPQGTTGSTTLSLNAGDYVEMYVYATDSGSLYFGGARVTYFTGYLIG